jgi:hypothetical protein
MGHKNTALGLSVFSVLGICIMLSLFPTRGADSAQAAPPAESEKTIVNVEDLMKKPDHYKGRISVVGVVSGVSAEQKTLAIIGRREFSECGVTTCAKLTLPIRWLGSMPDIKDEVLLEGEIQSVNGKLIFSAKSLKKLPLHEPKDDSE